MKQILIIVSLTALASCGSESSPSAEEAITESNCVSGNCTDRSGDAAFPFIDMRNLVVSIDNSEISVAIGLSNIPALFIYNSVNVLDSRLEYDWRVFFDVDGDGTIANDIYLSTSYFKKPGGVETQDTLLNFTQKSFWQVDGAGAGASLVGAITVTQNAATLNFVVQKSLNAALDTISQSTPFKFQTYYRNSGTTYRDLFPDDGSYTN